VQRGGPADSAGISSGDVITAIDGTAVTSPNELQNVMTTLAPKQQVPVIYDTSGGTAHTVTVTLTTGTAQ
jgi:S1-C subfamily serine protease